MLKEAVLPRLHCRVSGGVLTDLLSLGDFYPSTFLSTGAPLPARYPLTLAQAADSGLVQLRHSVPAEQLFRRYWYRSGTNESMQTHLEGLVRSIQARQPLKAGDVVVDIGCNDGTLLGAYPPEVVRVGIDPAQITPSSVDVFINTFFSRDVYADLPPAQVVTSIAMFYDLDNPLAFARDVYDILANDGLWVLEMHYLPDMLAMNGVDAICHEHLCYYSLASLEKVLTRAGFEIEDIAFFPVNGGSFRVYVRKQGHADPTALVAQTRKTEPYRLDMAEFLGDVQVNKQRTQELLARLKAAGLSVLGYGASTKGNTLLQFYELDRDLLPAIADRNPDKWGLETVGTGIPIISEAEARSRRPDYLFLLPYHFLPAFTVREREFLQAGGQFIVPMPYPKVVA